MVADDQQHQRHAAAAEATAAACSLRYSELAAKVEADSRAAVADLDATIAKNDALIALRASRNAFRMVDLAQILPDSEARP